MGPATGETGCRASSVRFRLQSCFTSRQCSTFRWLRSCSENLGVASVGLTTQLSAATSFSFFRKYRPLPTNIIIFNPQPHPPTRRTPQKLRVLGSDIISMRGEESKFKKDHESRVGGGDLTTGSTLFNDKYVLGQLIGRGSFGEVFRGVSTLAAKEEGGRFPRHTAIKVENDLTKASQIANEITVLSAVHKQHRNSQGFPTLVASGVQSGHSFMIMQLLGPNLQDLMLLCGGKFTLKTALLLTVQILERVEVLHELGYVYRDVKPENFLMGVGPRSKQVFMVDFGLCKRFRDQNTRLFLPYRQSVSMVGTIRYSSLNSHLGIDQTRRDDLQSVLYLLIYFLRGELPWQGMAFEHKFEKDHMIMDCKLKMSASELCSGLPQEILNVFEYIKNLDYYEDPDYRYIIAELTFVFENRCDLIDLQYDWEHLPPDAKLEKTHLDIAFPSPDQQEMPQMPEQESDIMPIIAVKEVRNQHRTSLFARR